MVFLDELFGAFEKSPYLCIVSNSTKLHKMRERADDCRETGVSFIKDVFLTTNIFYYGKTNHRSECQRNPGE